MQMIRGRRRAPTGTTRDRTLEPHAAGGGDRPGRVVIISASAGAGHDGASRELARRLRQRGYSVDCLDLADIFPWGLGRLLRGTYHGMLSRVPWIYGMLFAIGGRFSRAAPITRALLRPVWPRVLEVLTPDTRAVISTYPVVSQILGPMRREGQLPVPVVTYLTDFAVNPIWVSPGVDLHCAAHETSRTEALALGAGGVRVSGRLVAPGFRPGDTADKRRARERFGLPAQGRLALLVAGSWGVGEVARTAAEIAATGAAVPVVVCGHNLALYRRLRRRRIGPVFGWVDDMPALLRAADVLVENAGGLTALEAMACGLPVATYRPIPGHGRANAATMARAGVVTWVRDRAELGPTLVELTGGTAGRRQRDAGLALFRSDPTGLIVETVLGVRPAPDARPAPEARPVRGAGRPEPVPSRSAPPGPVTAQPPAAAPTGPPRRALLRRVGLLARARGEQRIDGVHRSANRPERQG
jgi:processive 1,2-diacylglycerol beta-glucosyltransferase